MTKEERNEYMKIYRKNNKDKIKNIQKKCYQKNIVSIKNKRIDNIGKLKDYYKIYNEKNIERHKENNRNWYLKNKEKVKIRVKNYQKIKKNNDPLFKLKSNIRTMINNILSNRGFTKKSNTFNIVGCSYGEFIIYLESKFETWMNWENYGLYNGTLNYGWDIDHIEPLSNAKTEEELIKLNHYTNLQPLCSYNNRVIKRNN